MTTPAAAAAAYSTSAALAPTETEPLRGVALVARERGRSAEALAARLADAVARGRAELVPSQPDGRVVMLLRRLWPGALFRIMERKARA